MIEPVQADDALLSDIAAARRAGGLHLWWLGQSGFLVCHDGRCLLLDPYLSDSLTIKYANTDKPHVRMTRKIIEPQRLDFVSVVSSSHNHTDHLDPDTLRPLLRVNPELQIVIPEANRDVVAARVNVAHELPIGVDDGTTVCVNEFSFTGVPAAHETIERDAEGRCRFLGYIVRAGPWTIYHSGDTVLYDGMVDRLRQFEIDVALLPINGRAPERRVSGNLSGPEAAQLAHAIGARLVIPCHFEMFQFNTASLEPFIAECQRLRQPCHRLKAGERWSGLTARPKAPPSTCGSSPASTSWNASS